MTRQSSKVAIVSQPHHCIGYRINYDIISIMDLVEIPLHNGDIITRLARIDQVVLQHDPERARDFPYIQLLYLFLYFDFLIITNTSEG